MKQWKLSLGCHKGTMMSRDFGNPEMYVTREEAVAAYHRAHEGFRNIGYQVWFAKLTDPNGNETMLEQHGYRG